MGKNRRSTKRLRQKVTAWRPSSNGRGVVFPMTREQRKKNVCAKGARTPLPKKGAD